MYKFIIITAILASSIFAGVSFQQGKDVIDFEWTADKLDSSFVGDDLQFLQLRLPQSETNQPQGFPDIPVIKKSVILPTEGEWNLQIEKITWRDLGKADLAPVPFWSGPEDGPYNLIYQKDREIYSQNKWFGEDGIILEESGFIRRVKIGHLKIFPIRYNPVTTSIEILERVKGKIHIYNRTESKNSKGQLDKLEKSVISNSINSQDVTSYLGPKPRKRISQNVFTSSDIWYKIEISNSGLVKIDSDLFSSLDIDPSSVNPSDIRVFDDGWQQMEVSLTEDNVEMEEIPLLCGGLTDNSFDSGDALYFYARAPRGWEINSGELYYHLNRFTNSNYYWMSIGGSFLEPAKRLSQQDFENSNEVFSGKTLYHIEYDVTYAKTNYSVEFGWERTSDKTVSFLDDRLINSEPVEVRYRLIRVEDEGLYFGDPNVNGTDPDSSRVIGNSIHQSHFSEGTFSQSQNTINFNFVGLSVLFDFYEIYYSIELEANDNQLQFYGSDVPSRYIVKGFESEPLVFDITDRTNLRLIKTDYYQDSLYSFSDDSVGRIYYLTTSEQASAIEFLQVVEPVNLRERDFSSDILLIIPDGLQSDLNDYISHRESMGSDVEWVLFEDIQREYGFGVKDPTAIRNFLRCVYENSDSPPPFVMLVGDATWDPRGITDPKPTYCPAALCVSNAPDDYFYSVTYGDNVPDFAGGRVPINTINEWRDWVSKLIDYEANTEYGPWRTRFVFVADDDRITGDNGDSWTHTSQTSSYALSMPGWAEHKMIYIFDYPITTTGIKPQARSNLLKYWNEGASLINYIGHGNYRLWSHEEVFEATSCIPDLVNRNKLPLTISASCEVGLFYRTVGECIAELLILNPDGGSVSSVAATRMTVSNSNGALDYNMIQNCWGTGEKTTAGLALLNAKNGEYYTSNKGQYVLFGDPAMIIGPPELDVIMDATPDSLLAGNVIHIQGEVQEDSTRVDDFDGTAYILVYDSGYNKTSYSEILSRAETYYMPGNKLFYGPVDVTDGQFEADFIMPIDISYGTSHGRIVCYAHSDNSEGVGFIGDLEITGDTSFVKTDSIGPEIDITLQGTGFSEGSIVCGDAFIIAEISDTNGINISGGAGHSITLVLNGEEANAIDLSQYFSYNRNSHTTGKTHYLVEDLSPGLYTIRIKAWDNMGNSSFEEMSFEVEDCNLAISGLLAYPNPFAYNTSITFNIDAPSNVTVKIYTLSGKFVREFSGDYDPAFGIVYWDGKDEHGENVANGTYLIVAIARDANGNEDEIITKVTKIQ